ncbi:GroES-like protein [Lepidopterella palustris CBS 459.81]|uniref:GroES-like protein n=1 Tax=Lepidopterella palustris CBS 459.81 TaxID=1314670 RepID=A0A8E2E844_9PEZI|nr:GroES-like protein [Lepidopterella palustris CBS 459.81]
MTNQNQAAWITEARSRPLKVDAAPDAKAGPGEVVVKNAAIAINPVDWKIQEWGIFVQKYPNVLGEDIAGEIVEVGSGVSHLKKGDRAIAHCIGLMTNDPKNGAFQLYTVCDALTVSPIPSTLSFERGAVLPLAISTAAVGLFAKDRLALPFPTTGASKPTGKSVLIWGGSSSVGATAIQLAVAAGVEVVTIASKHNLDFVKSVGANHAFDYRSSSVVDDIVAAVKGTDFAGVYDAIGSADAIKLWSQVIQKVGAGTFACTMPEPEGIPEGIKGGGITALTINNKDKDIGQAIWGKFIPEALANGSFQAKPDPQVITGGLSKIQEACDVLKKGISAGKVVVKV